MLGNIPTFSCAHDDGIQPPLAQSRPQTPHPNEGKGLVHIKCFLGLISEY